MIVNECITGQDKKAYEQKLGEDLSADKILDEEYQLIKKHLFSSLNSRLLMDSKLSFEGIVCTWIASTPNLTGSQKEKLNRELLNIVKGLDPCHYDQKEDRHCEYYIEKLKNFLQSNKNNQDLKAVLNLKRGESGLTVLHLVSSVGKVTQGYNETVDLLLEAGANPNIQSDKGRTPLHYTDVLASAASLLKGKANPNIQDHRGETPLHHAASIGHTGYVNLLLEKKANPTIQNRKGETPLQVAIDNRYYYIEECFFTNDQKSLSAQLYCILDKYFSTYDDCIWSKDEDRSGYAANLINLTKNLKEFLGKHKNSEDLKVIFSIRERNGSSKILNYARCINKKVVDLFLSAGAGSFCKKEASLLDYRGSFYSVGEKYCLKSTLWNTPNQVKLNEFLSKISEVQDMYRLEEIVNEAISSGVRIGFSKQSSQGKKAYNFVDHVIEKISKLEKNPKVASNIICKLVSRGAVFNSKIGIGVIDALESEFNDHKANMVKVYENYISNTHKFIELAKSTTNGELHDVRIDNSTLYLEYSGDSIIDVAKITDRAGNLGLTQGSIEYERDIIRIGKSEVEIQIEGGIRYYTDLIEGSDIVLTFYTSLGNVDVRLYPDVQDKSKIIVEVSNREEVLEKFKGRKKELSNDCVLGEDWVYDAIENGYFERSGGLMRPEVISESNNKKVSWAEREELRRTSDSRAR
ncbi:ankyrin repeat domain-containing protein [Wolbachia endosymbiont of Rhagoletis indifferens]|uniref:ankyrin repeat domain-containing protein n=1 Tax=Wolbachia TaxID=953 RepID=UPI001ABE846D|nr:ankyrin repeat domain-containing protein [Wolbachia pipientis]QTG99456.1 ankyrin repeat domain-containing protein [Wolbachia pipientis]